MTFLKTKQMLIFKKNEEDDFIENPTPMEEPRKMTSMRMISKKILKTKMTSMKKS